MLECNVDPDVLVGKFHPKRHGQPIRCKQAVCGGGGRGGGHYRWYNAQTAARHDLLRHLAEEFRLDW